MADETSIDVSKKSVADLLGSGSKSRFMIPEYQRPYAWGADQINTLFDDLTEYVKGDLDSEYFLGCVVTYRNGKEQEVIDGQQRLTTLFLLLRALYKKLEGMSDSKARTNLMNRIAPTLWRTDQITGEADRSSTLIESRAIDDDANATLKMILETGETDPNAKDPYSLNYRLLERRINDYAAEESLNFHLLIARLLDDVIVLPIKADSQDTALMIFNTLNDRGLSLSDADIFKAKMYKYAGDGREEFVQAWQDLSAQAEHAGQSMQTLFYQYMFVLRAEENDRKTTIPGLRKWFSEKEFQRLRSGRVLEDLDRILNVWKVAINHEGIEGEPWSDDEAIRQALDILMDYPNEFWKYPTVIYYLKHHDEGDFAVRFLAFLRHLTAALVSRFAISPSVNSVKQRVLNLDAEILKSKEPRFDFKDVDTEELASKLREPHYRLVRMLLKVIAYHDPEQCGLLPERWEIEHIFPQKWDDMKFPSLSNDEVKAKLEHLGNKVPFEKNLNIRASNGYFSKKSKLYKESGIAVTCRLGAEHSDWNLEDIDTRDVRMTDLILSEFEAWGLNRNGDQSKISVKPRPTAEQAEQIRQLKELGLI